MIRCRTISCIDTIAYTAMERIGHMEHNNGTWKKDVVAFFTSYGYEPMEHDGVLKVYIDGMPSECWKDEEGYHFSFNNEMEAIESTWKRISALVIRYMTGEYIK